MLKNFDIKKYLGKWYEIARFDYRFEKNMDNVTAEYSENSNGTGPGKK
ncbi:lipocalin family protein [Chryseobacterium sp. P1-3]